MSDAPDSDTRAPAEQSDGAAVLRGLEEADMIDLLNRLMLFAARRYYGRLNVEELVMQALADTLAGERAWNKAYLPFYNLCWILRSIASNQLQKEKRLLPSEPCVEVEAGSDQATPMSSPYLSPSEIYEAAETQRGLNHLLHEAAGDDELSRKVVEVCLEQEEWKPKEMAAALNVTEEDIYNARRRLRRRLGRRLNES